MKRKYVIIICIIAIIATLAISASAIAMNEMNKNTVKNITIPVQNNTTNTTNITNNTTTIKEEQNTHQEIQKEDSKDRDGTLKAQTAREEANKLSDKQGVNEETRQKRADAWEQQAKTGKIYNGR